MNQGPIIQVNQTKSSVTAGVLQLLFGWLGIGRFYLGYKTIGSIQLGLTVLSWFLLIVGTIGAGATGSGAFGGAMILAWIIWPIVGIWVLIEAFVMFAGGIKEKGR
ncbi:MULTISPECIES: NINE protein [Mycobacteroides]|uniref:NINE protein n=1 Tax=Mycobacteroides TaxID=670516 RepID=UPI0007131393|nr:MULTISPECIES: TM2 domain-containing protein [Mycobacteroides]KRQ21920.1 hypothetical protein AOT91_24775 [Mycobacteroides sp. H092]KRQ46118.1 hypothetical protein AOT92_02160 [Mycobacteroides sp. H101]KRQ49382.1 hypothetical protein AOT88_10030 [Mycobacteroides sp. H063]KRQ52309.1 hypothetical protein AOT94_27480 [Mycobacteroides sp. HXVII]KRQ62948.1 hypothetical protein AOT90_14160 [Mycobacteroides sp. H079]